MTPPARVIAPASSLPLMLTCEHASTDLPAPWRWPESDAWLVGTHWSFDFGAAALTEALARATGAPAVLAGFTRLLVDPNRPLDSDTLFRDRAEGRSVSLNVAVSPSDRAARIDGYWRPFHAAVDEVAIPHRPRLLLSIHSFTPVYEGVRRAVEVGVLHAGEPVLAAQWQRALATHGYDVRVDEPYVGAGGFIYSAETHAARAGARTLELEFRQDLLADPVHAARLERAVLATLSQPMWHG